MIIVDTNVLLYGYDSASPHHSPSRQWIETEFSSGRPVGLALVTLLAFVRISSDRRVYTRPLKPSAACDLVESWLGLPNVRLIQPGTRTWMILSALCEKGQAKGAMVMDAHLAALAVEHGARIATTDRDFARFANVEFLNPLEIA